MEEEENAPSRSTPEEKGGAKRPRVYSKASPPPAPQIKEKSIHFSAPVPLFVNSVDFRGFRVGDGEGTTWVPSNQFFIFSVFLCDFCVFRVMIRPSKRIPYTKPTYIQRIYNGNPDSFHHLKKSGPCTPEEERGALIDRGCTRRLRPRVRARGGENSNPPLSPFS